MAIPDYQALMLPLLQAVAEGKEQSISDAADLIANQFGLSEEERNRLLGSGQQTVLRNRVGWARTYMKKAGLLESPRRGYVRITERGRSILAKSPQRIDNKFLEQFPEYLAFRELRHSLDESSSTSTPPPPSSATPEDALDSAYEQLRLELEAELLDQIMKASPTFFERLVVELLVRMGYGGTLRDAGQAVGKSGDDGIDGTIKEDRLGLDVIYIQAKRWEGTVGRPEVQKFAGALQGKRAKKGVMITTSSFSKEAEEYVRLIDSKIVLIDGAALVRFMIDHNVGVNTVQAYEVKRIDSDFFSEE
jgi:restriction system protein